MQDNPRIAQLIAECRRRRAAGADDGSLAAWLRTSVPPDVAVTDILQAALGCDAAEARRIAGSAATGAAAAPGLQPVPGTGGTRRGRSFGRRPDVTGSGRAAPEASAPHPAGDAGAGPAPGRPVPPRLHENEAELARAAQRLGIRFRESGVEVPAELLDGSHDDAVRKLGIRFREDDPEANSADVADDLSLEAERLGIRFREPGKIPRKAAPGLIKYWFWIALAVALAIIMPVLVQSVGPFMAHFND